MSKLVWPGAQNLPSRTYHCGFCGSFIAAKEGFSAHEPLASGSPVAFIYHCHFCTYPTFFSSDGTQIPGAASGDPVNDIADMSVENLYEEARRCTAANAFTAAVLCCRKLLMHIAVEKKAEKGKNFTDYVEYLADHGFVPPDGKAWVDHIRTKGNEANHEIVLSERVEAEDLLVFAGMLLKFVYEFPARLRQAQARATTATP